MITATMNTEPARDPRRTEQLERQTRSFYRAIPFYLAVPVAFWAAFAAFGIPLDWRLVGLGALGWWIALVLRAPLAPLVKRLPAERGKWLMVGASGPLEEGIRVLAAAPLLVLLAAPLHGAVNLLALRLTPRIGMMLGMLALVGTTAFLAGLVLMGALP